MADLEPQLLQLASAGQERGLADINRGLESAVSDAMATYRTKYPLLPNRNHVRVLQRGDLPR